MRITMKQLEAGMKHLPHVESLDAKFDRVARLYHDMRVLEEPPVVSATQNQAMQAEAFQAKPALPPIYVCNDCNSANIREEAYLPVSDAAIDAGNNVVMHGEGRRAYLATIFRAMYAQMLKEQRAPQSMLHTDFGGWHVRTGDDWRYSHSRTKPRNNFSPFTHRRKTDAPGNSCFHSRSGDKR